MLTNEQCIEVAKLWGYESTEHFMDAHEWMNPNLYARWRRQPEGNEYYERFKAQMYDEAVNSWQGFGRTVEAMVGYQFIAKGDGCGFCKKPIKKHEIIFHNYDYKVRDRTEMITATHIAALEALKDD